MVEAIENGSLMRLALSTYKLFDHGGYLSWSGGEVLRFASEVFKAMDLESPREGQVFKIFSIFDSDDSGRLNASECLCLVDALFRAVVHLVATCEIAVPTETSEAAAASVSG